MHITDSISPCRWGRLFVVGQHMHVRAPNRACLPECCRLPVTFTPPTSGQHLGTIFVVSDTQEVSLRMQGECKEVSWR